MVSITLIFTIIVAVLNTRKHMNIYIEYSITKKKVLLIYFNSVLHKNFKKNSECSLLLKIGKGISSSKLQEPSSNSKYYCKPSFT